MATQGAEPKPYVLVAGSLNADLTIYTERLPAPGETVHGNGFAVYPGGKSANQAVAAARVGAPVKMLGAVGDDDNGQMLRRSLGDAGVDTSSVGTSNEPTGVAIISVDASAENSIIISAGANGTFSAADVERSAGYFMGAGAVCLCLEVSVEAVMAAASLGHAAGAKVLLNLSPFARVPGELLALADVLLVNEHEASQLLVGAAIPEEDDDAGWQGVGAKFAELGVNDVLLTRGANGSVVLERVEGKTHVTPISATAVTAVDTTGAGDAFTGAVAAGLVGGKSLVDAAREASVVAAIATTRKGAQAAYPTRAELAEFTR